jgi:hypothetical protein
MFLTYSPPLGCIRKPPKEDCTLVTLKAIHVSLVELVAYLT